MKKLTPVFAGLLVLLSACSNLSEMPAAIPETEPLNVVKVAGRWLVKNGSQEAALLWRSQNPVGETVTVRFADSSSPAELTLTDGRAFVGDMLVGDVREGQVIGVQGQAIANVDGSPLLSTQGFGINRTGDKWPNAVVPYVFDRSATGNIRSQFEQARRTYTEQTGIRFVPRTNEAQYVRVVAGSGCSSYVGRVSASFKPNGQELTLGKDGCGYGAALHEMGHAAGLEHEQTRCDRDEYVEIRFQYIVERWQSQYAKNCNSNRTSHTPYDYKSIMHYRNAQTNGQWQMLDRKGKIPPQDIGNGGNILTGYDKAAFNAVYGEGGGDGGSGGNGGGRGGAGITLPKSKWVSFRVRTSGYTDRFLVHRGRDSQGFTGVVNSGSRDLAKQDASFRVVAALDGTPCYSLESRSYPGYFLRHKGFRLRNDRFDGSELFRKDATFCAQTGLATGEGVSLVSRNLPGYYVRHYKAEVWLAKKGGSLSTDTADRFDDDVSWDLVDAWAP